MSVSSSGSTLALAAKNLPALDSVSGTEFLPPIVQLDQDVFNNLSLYAKLKHKNLASVINHALEEWWTVTGEVEMESLTGVPASRVELKDHPHWQ